MTAWHAPPEEFVATIFPHFLAEATAHLDPLGERIRFPVPIFCHDVYLIFRLVSVLRL